MRPEPAYNLHSDAEATPAGDFLARMGRQKSVIYSSVAVFLILGTVYTLWVPPRWSAESSILLPGSRPSAAGTASQTLGINLGGGDTSLTMFHKILDSERILRLVQKSTGYPVADIRKIRRIEEDTKGGLITIAIADRSKEKALSINRAMLSALRSSVSELMLPSKGRRAELLQASLTNKTRQLSEAEDRLEAFTRNAITSPGAPETSSSSGGSNTPGLPTVSSAFRYQNQATNLALQLNNLDARLRASQLKSEQASSDKTMDFPPVAVWQRQLSEIEGRLSAARATYKENTPEVANIKREYDNVNALLQRDVERYLSSVERNVSGTTASLDVERQGILSQIQQIRKLAEAAPREATEYQRLTRNVATLTSLVMQLRLQYEQARMDTVDDPNRWVVLDQPSIADEPVNKNYVRNVGLAGLLGFLISLPIASSRDARRKVRRSAA